MTTTDQYVSHERRVLQEHAGRLLAEAANRATAMFLAWDEQATARQRVKELDGVVRDTLLAFSQFRLSLAEAWRHAENFTARDPAMRDRVRDFIEMIVEKRQYVDSSGEPIDSGVQRVRGRAVDVSRPTVAKHIVIEIGETEPKPPLGAWVRLVWDKPPEPEPEPEPSPGAYDPERG